MSFEQAKAFIQAQGIVSVTQFQEWRKPALRPHNFPSNPDKIYKEKWNGWKDFLGAGNTHNQNRMSFQEPKAHL